MKSGNDMMGRMEGQEENRCCDNRRRTTAMHSRSTVICNLSNTNSKFFSHHICKCIKNKQNTDSAAYRLHMYVQKIDVSTNFA